MNRIDFEQIDERQSEESDRRINLPIDNLTMETVRKFDGHEFARPRFST